MRFQDYEIIGRLYRSQTTEVLGVKNRTSEQQAVIKLLRSDYPSTERVQRFKQEFDILQVLAARDNDLIIRPIDLIFENQTWGLILEDFGGKSLDSLNLAGKLDTREFLELAIRITTALDKIHKRHIIHCDINPSNILIHPKTRYVKLIDFDIASRFSRIETSYQSPNTLKGTLAYISPEQTGRMNRSIDFRSDFYSLGVTLYELATGVRPFKHKDHVQLIYEQIAINPVSPQTHANIPGPVARIILKLMEKDAGNRYQSASGLKADLETCLAMVRSGQEIRAFSLGRKDRIRTLGFSHHLFGRKKETHRLVDAYQKMVNGDKRLVTVGGLPGVGKSSLVKELHKPVTRDCGFFLSGKFNPLKKNVPYTAFIQAMDQFAHMVITEEPDRFNRWKRRLNKALGNIGQVIIDAVPFFEKVVGPQPPVPPLNGPEAKHRVFFAWRLAFKAMATAEHPLVLFLDDMQWADQGSLDLLWDLMQHRDLDHFLPVCAFRSSEINTGHPFTATLDQLKSKVEISHFTLGNLSRGNTLNLVRDSLGQDKGLDDLAGLIQQKTLGNPFFTQRLLSALYDKKYLRFDARTASWRYDLDQLNTLDISDSVVQLLSQNFETLSPHAMETLKYAACIGSRFSLERLSMVTHKNIETLEKEIGECVEANLLHHQDYSRYAFAHDRILNTAYASMNEGEKAAAHWKIGWYLFKGLSMSDTQEQLFEIMDHLFLGKSLLKNNQQREEMTRLAIRAGTMAKASGVFSKAYEYFSGAAALYEHFDWDKAYALGLTLYTEAAVTAGLTGRYGQMDRFVAIVKENAQTVIDQVEVYQAVAIAFNSKGEHLKTVDTALELLSMLGISFPQAPDDDVFLSAFTDTMALVAGMDEKALFDRPDTIAPRDRAAMGMISLVSDAVFHSRPALLPHLVFKQIEITLKHGICPESSAAFALFGLILCGPVQDIETGVKFGSLAMKVLDRTGGAEAFKAKTILIVNNCIMHWKYQNRNGLEHFITGFRSGLETGDLMFAAISAHAYCYNALFTGMPLSSLHAEMVRYDKEIQDIGQIGALNFHRCYYQAVENLVTPSACRETLSGSVFDYQAKLPELLDANDRTALFVLNFCHLFLGTYLGKTTHLEKAVSKAREYQDGVVALIHNPMLNFYESLYLLGRYKLADPEEKKAVKTAVRNNQQQLQTWAKGAPSNHEYKYLLIEAKSEQLWGVPAKAEKRYERAADCARENGYCHDEFLIRKHLALFYFETERFGSGMKEMTRAYHLAQQWGAEAVVRQMQQEYFNHISMEGQHLDPHRDGTFTATVEFVDRKSLVKAFQTLSAEIHLGALLEKMTEIMIQNAGATRGFFLERRGNELLVQAAYDEQTISGILSSRPLDGDAGLPMSVLNYVVQSQEAVLLNNLALDRRFYHDPAAGNGKDRSILCVPIIHQGKLIALIYLENDLAQGVFTKEHMDVIGILAGQAAISYENAKLYDTLEKKVRERTKALATANEKLQHLAATDKLTGIANRRTFDETLDREWERLKREQGELSLILCDIDFFKKFNDGYGHQAGDDCLAMVAQTIQNVLSRPGDLAARYGGEEFAVILPRTGSAGALAISEKIRCRILALEIPNKRSLTDEFVTISLGVATTVPTAADACESLINTADKALYKAKEMGRNQAAI